MSSSKQPYLPGDTDKPVSLSHYGDINLLCDSLGYEIKKAQVRSYEVLFELLGPDGLSPARVTALCIVGNQPGINQSELAEALRVNRASVVKVIDALAARGYVERQSIPEDRRSYALVVTPSGYEELRRLTVLFRGYDQRLANDLSATERATLMSLLARVAIDPQPPKTVESAGNQRL